MVYHFLFSEKLTEQTKFVFLIKMASADNVESQAMDILTPAPSADPAASTLSETSVAVEKIEFFPEVLTLAEQNPTATIHLLDDGKPYRRTSGFRYNGIKINDLEIWYGQELHLNDDIFTICHIIQKAGDKRPSTKVPFEYIAMYFVRNGVANVRIMGVAATVVMIEKMKSAKVAPTAGDENNPFMDVCEDILRNNDLDDIRKIAKTFGDLRISSNRVPVANGAARASTIQVKETTSNSKEQIVNIADFDSENEDDDYHEESRAVSTRTTSATKAKKSAEKVIACPFTNPLKELQQPLNNDRLDAIINLLNKQGDDLMMIHSRLDVVEKAMNSQQEQKNEAGDVNSSNSMMDGFEQLLNGMSRKRKADNDGSALQIQGSSSLRGLSDNQRFICAQTIIGLIFN